nr:membrane-bound lytic murein transglycosylase F [uncultured bacterium]
MRVARLALFLLSVAMMTLTAQSEPAQPEIRLVSIRWAEYYAAVYRVPLELVMAIIDEESAWSPYAVSQKGAVGLMQLMPQTARRFGVRDRFRPDENIRGGVAYLAWLNREFGGDLRLVTAAYYVGEDPISRRKLAYSCADVQNYVKRVARRYRARRRRAVNLAFRKRARR